MKTISFVAFTLAVLFLVHTTPTDGNLFFGADPTTTTTTTTSTTSTTTPAPISLPASYVMISEPVNQIAALPQTAEPAPVPQSVEQIKLPTKSATMIKNPLLAVMDSLLGKPDPLNQSVFANSESATRALSSNRLLLVLLIPLLATPFVPAALIPLLILTSTFAIFVQQFGRLSSASRLVDFAMNALSLEPQFNSFESNRHGNMELSLSGLYEFWSALLSRLHMLTSIRGLQQLTQRTLDYFGASQSICQQRMVCEAAFSVATRMPAGFSNLVRSATGFLFTRINNNDFFRAWLVGLTNDNCTVTYQSCPNSPFRNMLQLHDL